MNLVGREPQGKVAPGPEYEALLEQLSEDLVAITNLETGRPIVKAIHWRDRLYAGPEREHLPDLMVEWSNDAPTRCIGSNRIGRIDGEYRYCRTGDHKSGGMFIVKGPHTRPTIARTVRHLRRFRADHRGVSRCTTRWRRWIPDSGGAASRSRRVGRLTSP